MSYENEIQQGVELLKLCQQLQSEKDGVNRPLPGVVDKTKTLDEFAVSVSKAIGHMTSLHSLLPMSVRLAELGRHLEQHGEIKLIVGEDYADAALEYVLAEHGMAGLSRVLR